MPLLLVSPNYSTLFMIAAMVLAFWFLLVRPMKKQADAFAKRQEELRTQVAPGVRVMLNSGLFGTISHVGDKQVVLELAPGLQVTTLKESIAKVVGPEDEEFEFETEDDVVDAVDLADEAGSTDEIDASTAHDAADDWAAPVDASPAQPAAGSDSATSPEQR